MLIPSLAAAITSYLIGLALMGRLAALLLSAGFHRPNFSGAQLPVGVGLEIPLAAIPGTIIWLLLSGTTTDISRGVAAALLLMGMALVGFLDDAAGDGSFRGLGGHLKALQHGHLTTGSIKALFGLVLAVLAALVLPWRGWLAFLLTVLLVALTANTINLLDLRPGRAVKAFSFGYLVTALGGATWGGPIAAVAGAALALAPWDLAGKVMMGDTGANTLGSALGLFLAISLPTSGQAAVAIALVALHVVAEKQSFSAIIDRSAILHWIDMWGRRN